MSRKSLKFSFLLVVIFILHSQYSIRAQSIQKYAIVTVEIVNNTWRFEELCPEIVISLNDSLLFSHYV